MEEFGQHPYHPFWFLTGADELYIWQSQNELTSSSRVSIELKKYILYLKPTTNTFIYSNGVVCWFVFP